MERLSDEEKARQTLERHLNLKKWIMNLFKKDGIKSEETYGNDKRGDIIVVNPEDVPKAKKKIREINEKFNG